MKKTLFIAALVVATAANSFAQGNVLWSGGIGAIKQNTNGTPSNVAGLTVALLFSSGASLPSVAGIAGTGFSTGAVNGGSFVGATFSSNPANTSPEIVARSSSVKSPVIGIRRTSNRPNASRSSGDSRSN